MQLVTEMSATVCHRLSSLPQETWLQAMVAFIAIWVILNYLAERNCCWNKYEGWTLEDKVERHTDFWQDGGRESCMWKSHSCWLEGVCLLQCPSTEPLATCEGWAVISQCHLTSTRPGASKMERLHTCTPAPLTLPATAPGCNTDSWRLRWSSPDLPHGADLSWPDLWLCDISSNCCFSS